MAFRRLFIIILGWERVGVWLIGFMGGLVGKVSEMEGVTFDLDGGSCLWMKTAIC